MNDDELFDKLWDLNPTGSKENTRIRIDLAIYDGVMTAAGPPITMEFLFDKYKEYLVAKQPLQNDKFTRKEDRIKVIYDFVDQQIFNESYSGPRKARDHYIYGPNTIEDLKQKSKDFDKWIKEHVQRKGQ